MNFYNTPCKTRGIVLKCQVVEVENFRLVCYDKARMPIR